MRVRIIKLVLCAGLYCLNSNVFAHDYDGGRPDGHAPIGVMGDHRHAKGETMLSYRTMLMGGSGSIEGDQSISTSVVLSEYMMAPIEMDRTMHMIGTMWAPTDSVTLAMGLNYVESHMTMQPRMPAGARYEGKAEGIGDIRLMSIWDIGFDRADQRVHLNVGLSLPTGSIDNQDQVNPSQPAAQLPYGMQNGSGTWDVLLGTTYIRQNVSGSWGAQWMATIRTQDNDRDYRLGNALMLTAWQQKNLSDVLSLSLRVKHTEQGRIQGRDTELTQYMMMTPRSPSVFPENYGVSLTEMGVGMNYIGQSGVLSGHRFALEYLYPVRQDASGVQLERDAVLVLGWQKAFKPVH